MRLPIRLFLSGVLLLSACSAPQRTSSNPQATLTALYQSPTPSRTPSPSPPSTQTLSPSVTVTITPGTVTPLTPGSITQTRGARSPSPTALSPSPTPLPLPTTVARDAPTPTPAPTSATPSKGTPTATNTPAPSLLAQYMPRAKKVAETTHFIFYAQDDYFPVDQAWWTQEAESLYTYVSGRVKAEAKNKIALGFLPPEKRACPIRGLTSDEANPMVLIYADAQSPRPYLLAVLSHELGHAVPAEGFQGGLPDSLALTEGLASWASGKYWSAWFQEPSLDDMIRSYIEQGQYEPISQNYDLHGIYPWQDVKNETSQDCLARRDKIYSEWADFLGYLIDTYGWDKAHQLFHNPAPVHKNGETISFPPDYQGIYGKTLNQLEWEWLNYLNKK